MGKVVVSEFISLDGVVEDPGGSEGFCEAWPSRSGEFADSETLILIYEPDAKDEEIA